ncbi:MAG: hypothetical protein WDO68_06980 [Gammaproteobacteria bacterium]
MATVEPRQISTAASSVESPRAMAERVLVLLELTHRPLRWTELSGALALRQREGQRVRQWLADQRYIVAAVDPAQRDGEPAQDVWCLGEKGRGWSRSRSALAVPDRP